ncbi:MAG: SRPBCC family protein [Nannocystales bacterium]
MTRSVELDASAARVWGVLGDGFADIGWVRSIRASRLEGDAGVGAVRVCEFEPSMLVRSGAAKERLVEFDEEARVMAYELLEPASPMEAGGSRWQVTALGQGRCRVTVTSTVVLRPWVRLLTPALRMMVGRLMSQTFEDLATRVSVAAPTSERTPQPRVQPGR